MSRLPDIAEYFPFYSTYFEIYSPKREETKPRILRLNPFFERYIKPLGGRVLDLCCGAGLFSFELEKMGLEVVGVDLQEKMIEEAKDYAAQIGPKIKFVKGDARSLEFSDGYFDSVVLLGNTLPNFSVDDFARVAAEISRVLKSSGRFLVDYSDFVYTMFKTYERVLYERSTKGDVFSFHASYNPEEGIIERIFHNFTTNETFHLKVYIWTPWMFRYLVYGAGLRKDAFERIPPNGYIDVLRK